jgi:precorrin-6B methylase 1
MANERAHLAQADQHIALAREHISRQRQLIKRLAARGRELGDAQQFLAALTSTLAGFERHRLLILERLASEEERALLS